MRVPILAFFFLFFQLNHAQEKFLEIHNDLKDGARKVHTAFTIVDDQTGNFAVFLDDENKLYGFLYDSDLNLIDRFTSDGLPKKYSEIIGYSIKGELIRLFLKDNRDKRFGSVLFNFSNGKTEETLYDFKLKDEVYVEGYNDASTFYLITMTKESSLFNLYLFDEGSEFQKETIDLSGERFIDNFGNQQNLNRIMAWGGARKTNGSLYSFKIDKIDSQSPNSIETVSEIVKMYPGDSSFQISVETQVYTYLIHISTEKLEYSLQKIEKPRLSDVSPNSNSFILKDKIYQISSTKEEMAFSVKSLDSDKELKSILVNKDDELYFKNTPIIQEGGAYSNYREMEKTSKFLRRLSKEDIGIAVTEHKNHYIITMGSKKEVYRGGGGMMMPGFGIPVASAGAFTVMFNPTFVAYGGYSNTKATQIECIFDENFNHKEGEVPTNIFDKIHDATEVFPKKTAENIFKLNGNYIWGYYNKKLDKYIMYKF